MKIRFDAPISQGAPLHAVELEVVRVDAANRSIGVHARFADADGNWIVSREFHFGWAAGGAQAPEAFLRWLLGRIASSIAATGEIVG